MIDLILWAADKPTLSTFAKAKGLLVKDTDDKWVTREGVEWSWWGGTGQLMRTPGDDTVDPTFIPGVVVVLRMHGDFFASDRIAGGTGEQWARSKVARFIKNNGVSGVAAGVSYYELDGVRIFRFADVVTKLAEWGVPGHGYAGGHAP